MYSKTISFDSPDDITFNCRPDSIEILVNDESLGYINDTYPVTVFVHVGAGGSCSITLAQITDNTYRNNNTDSRTIIFNQNDTQNNLQVGKCNGSDKYVLVGDDDDVPEEICSSGTGTYYFDISAELAFKSKMENINNCGYKMVVRYGEDILGECGSSPLCAVVHFCYTCSTR